jgi:hypothetical protein
MGVKNLWASLVAKIKGVGKSMGLINDINNLTQVLRCTGI